MKFGKHLERQMRPEWAAYYIDYGGLKDLIKEAVTQAEQSGGAVAFSPRTTSLSIVRAAKGTDAAEERFFQRLEGEVEKIGKFTQRLVDELRAKLRALNPRAAAAAAQKKGEAAVGGAAPAPPGDHEATAAALMAEAKTVGEEYLALEKYANLNYMGIHKILKKHDKMLPHAPCRQFYISHLHQQPWVQGTYSDVLVQLSNVYSSLRGDASGTKNEDSAQGFVRSTTKYWVRAEDVSNVKYHLLMHLPVFQFERDNFAGDAQLINSVYFDNDSLELYHGRLDKKPGAIALRIRWYGNGDPGKVFMERKTHRESWKGEESVKERFTIDDAKVVPFLEMEYDEAAATADLRAAGKSDKDIAKFMELFTEVRNQVDAKQLRPFIRTQYMRTAFQIPFDATVRVSMDTNLCMIKENPDDGPSCAVAGRWYRDPSLPVPRTEVTRFPHAVLEVKLSLPDGQTAPPWVQELLDSGYLTEVHKFSKFIHGTCTLFPELVQAVPYWVDDESVRASMLASAPAPGAGGASGGQNGAGASFRRAGNDSDDDDEGGGGDEEAPGGGRARSFANPDKPRKRLPGTLDDLRHPLLGEAPLLRLLPGRDAIRGFGNGPARAAPRGGDAGGGGAAAGGIAGWLMSAIGPPTGGYRRVGTGPGAGGPIPMRLEPKTFLANERTFLSWLHMTVTLGSIAAALLSFAGTAPGGDPAAPGARPLSAHLVEIIALILLPLAIAMCVYAVFIFWWRGSMIALKRPGHFDDRLGPLGLCGAVVLALSAIFVVSLIDYAEVASAAPPPGPASGGGGAALLLAAEGARRAQVASAAGAILPLGRIVAAAVPKAA